MATRRRRPREQAPNGAQTFSAPSQEDEADILAEVGGERDEGGELLVDEGTVQEIGAVDAASVRENRRMSATVNKKRGGEKNIVFNTDDLLTKYEELIKRWPPNTLDISVKRLTGSAVTHTITSRPRSGVELYEALKGIHGQYEEAQYEVKFLDSNQRQYRGTGRITMPDTRPAGQQGQQPMYNPNGNGAPPPGYQPPPHPYGYPPAGVPAPVAQPSVVMPQPTDPIAMMRQMFEMFQTMSQRPVPPAPGPSVPVPQVVPADPMTMMKQMFELFQQTQGVAAPPPAPQPVVVAAPAPPPPAPPSIDPMAMMKQMFEMFRDMQASLTPPRSPMQRPPYAPQDGDPRPPYARPAYGGQQPPPPPREKTMTETFRESMGVIRSAHDMLQEMEGLIPNREQQESISSPEDDDSPVRVIDTGHAKIVVNKNDGSTRLWETGVANMDKIFKWVGEQRKEIQAEARQRQQRQAPQRQQLPPGYVEVGPGFQPPPGYRAVAVEESDLPPPPEDVPPPIQEQPPVRQAWGDPTIPDEQGEHS